MNFSASYIGELVTNWRGGIHPGTDYLGLANLKLSFDPQKAGLWKNGFFFINAANTHGGQPSAYLVGDFQGVSNIEVGNLSFLYELWYKQTFGRVTLVAGLQDLNATFAVNEEGSSFVNSSFGIHSSIADNIPAPVFPLTALGLSLQWQISETMNWQASVFDGTPDNFESNPYNTNWKLSKNDGYTLISEFQWARSFIDGMQGCYKLGGYYHEHRHEEADIKKNYGFYLVADQQITKNRDRSGGLFLFSQIGLCPRNQNLNNHYFSLGAVYKGLLRGRPSDEAGVAIAYAGFNRYAIHNETAIELNWQMKLNEKMFIKPDLQYIINPAGTDARLSNALVSSLRIAITI